MRKTILSTVVSVLILFGLTTPVFAEEYYAANVGYQVKSNEVWSDYAYGGALAGSQGNDALTSISLHLVDAPDLAAIEYRVYTSTGWQEWVNNFDHAGYDSAILGVQVKLSNYPNANVFYQTYRKGLGWGIWVSNGKTSGKLDVNHPITGIRVQVEELGVNYQSSVNGTLKSIRHNGETQGSGNLETLSMSLSSSLTGVSILYRAYFQNEGWSSWAKDSEVIGTVGSGKIIEAIQAKLDGTDKYYVSVQPYVKDSGWWAWSYNGATAGTIGKNQPLEAYRVKIERKVYIEPVVEIAVTPATPAVVIGGGSTINTTPIQLDIDDDGFDDPFYTVSNSYATNRQLVSNSPRYRVTNLTVVTYSSSGIPVIDGFNSFGDDAVNTSQFEVYNGTYVNDIFTILTGTGVTVASATTAGATHTMILYDNEDESVAGYTSLYSGDPEHLNGIVMQGVYHESGWSISGASGSRILSWH